MAGGRQALAEGRFRLALRKLNAAIALREQDSGLLNAAQHRTLNQLQRQADLLARLSSRSLEQILLEASQVRDAEEWQARFNDFDRGKTVLFDDVVGRDVLGRPALTFYAVHVQDEVARVALEDLTLLQQLPLDPAVRMLFGGRLARCGREKGGAWVVRFQPGSAVLLTDTGAAEACCPVPLDPELHEVLRRQAGWLQELRNLRPARP
jgi:hypothetical protein